jgi:hypothetical protein
MPLIAAIVAAAPTETEPKASRTPRHVRVEVEVLAREQGAGPAESARDFIGNEQRAVTAAEVAHTPDDVIVSNQGAEVDADRLDHERGDVTPLQPLLDPAKCLRVELRCDLAAVRQQVFDALAVVGRADAQPRKRVAVVAAFERQQCVEGHPSGQSVLLEFGTNIARQCCRSHSRLATGSSSHDERISRTLCAKALGANGF